MKNKILVVGSAAAVCMSFAFAYIAFASDVTGGAAMQGDSMMHKDATPSSMMMMHPPAPMILNIGNDGMGRLRGVVASVSTTSITVATWGGVWTINAGTDTQLLPGGSSLASIKVGDYVGAAGSVSENGPTMTAKIIRDWTTKNVMAHDTMMKDGHMKAGTKNDVMTH